MTRFHRMTDQGRIAVLCLAIATLCLATAARADGGAGSVAGAFRRGIGVGAMAWAAVEPDAPTKFVFPPYAGASYELAPGELRTLQRTGFDFIRLAVDPGPFLQFKGTQQEELDRILMDRVHLILASGLAVLVDFHPSDMNPDYLARMLTGGLHTPVFQSYLQMLRHSARLLGRLHSRRVALELINEPPVAPRLWQPMLEAAYAAARSGSPDLTLLLEGGDEASAPALMQMQTAPFAGDPAVLYSFHYYEPYQFTHEGASWNPARYLADVPYPADAHPIDDSLAATAALIAATDLPELRKSLAYQDAQARLEDYVASGFDSDTIKESFERIADWARSRGIPADRVILGEFGARKTALQLFGERARERAQWFHDVRTAAEAAGLGWSVWAYRGGGGFALAQSDASDKIEPGIAAALGLRSDAPRKANLADPKAPEPMP